MNSKFKYILPAYCSLLIWSIDAFQQQPHGNKYGGSGYLSVSKSIDDITTKVNQYLPEQNNFISINDIPQHLVNEVSTDSPAQYQTQYTSFVQAHGSEINTNAIATRTDDPTWSIPPLKTWIRRLNTNVDLLGIHKFSNLAYVISTTAIVAGGAAVGFESIPNFMEPLTYLFLASTVGQFFSSIRMANIYRRNDTVSRNMFMSAGLQSVYQAFLTLWIAPFAPSVFDHAWVSASANALFSIACIVVISNQAIVTPGIIERREAKSTGEATTLMRAVDYTAYLLPLIPYLPFPIWTLLTLGMHDRDWYFDACLTDTLPLARHADLSWAFYAEVFLNFAPSYGVFLATLRDKNLISKEAEMCGNFFLTVVAMYAGIHAFGYC